MLKLIGTMLLVLTFLLFSNAAHAKQEGDAPFSRYMGGPAELVTAPNGAITNVEALQKLPEIMYLEPTTQKVAEGVWCIGGYSVANTSVIEAEDGLIVYDTGDNDEEARHIRAAIEKISDKPIKVIIYSHSHYALGAGALVDNPEDVMIIGHPTLNDTVQANLRGGGAPSVYGEIGPVLTARAVVQMNNFLPEKGPDARLGGVIPFGLPTSHLPATVTPEHGESMDVLGIKMQFFTKYISDDHNLTVWIPEKGIVLNNFFWPGTPNLYTLRGGVYRDPRTWRNGLAMMRDLQPSILLNTHARAVVGKEEVLKRLNGYMDKITLTFDQTLRGILGGLGPDEISHEIYYPPHLNEILENAEVYGESAHFPAAIYQYAIGWFDNDVTRLFKIHPKEEARRMVDLIGGRDKVISTAKKAFEQKEYAWAAQVIQYAYRCDPLDKEVRQLKADILRKLGQLTTGSIPRAFLLSEARALEGEVTIPRLIPPAPENIAGSPTTFVDFFRVRIDPKKSQDTDTVLEFVFTDAGNQAVGLHVRRGIAEYIPVPADYYREADFVVKLDSETWATLYLSSVGLGEAIDSNAFELEKGKKDELIKVFEMFDRFQPAKNVTVPAQDDMTHMVR